MTEPGVAGRTPVRILLLEDSALDAELVTERLREIARPVAVERVWTRETFVAALGDRRPDLILADHALPTFDGEAALEIARDLAPDTPFVFVSGTLGEEVAVEAMKRGATDYVVKQRLHRLPLVVRRALAEAETRAGRAGAVRALRESEARYRSLVEATSSIVWNTSADGVFDTAQPGWSAFTGQDEAALRGWGWIDAIHPEDRAPTEAAWRRSLAGAFRYEIEHRLRRHDGAWRHMQARAVPIHGEDGTLREWVGVHADVTDRRRAEDALRALNAELGRRVEERTRERDRTWRLSRDLFLVAATDGTVLAVNPAWETILGLRDRDLIGRELRTFVDGDAAGAIGDILTVSRMRAQDGTVRWIAWTVAADDGQVYAVGRDVTREREREEQLRHVQKMETVGQLTGGIAHDFNNLLTPIMGSLDLLRRRHGGDARSRALINGAMQGAERAAILVNRLLAFARRQTLQPTAVDVTTLVAGMVDLIGRSIGPRIQVELALEDGLPPALVDPNQLELALLNLAVNARDAMPEGGRMTIGAGAVRVAAEDLGPGLAAGAYVRLWVADTGTGMSPETLRRATEPFFSTKGLGKGTGLGLSMVHGLALQSGGTLRLASTPGCGTTAEVWLPRAEGQADPVAPVTARPVPVAVGARPATVLLVDDEDLVRLGTADMLTDLGHAVIEAASGAQALERLHRGLVPDLLVTDHLMPGMTGPELVREARRLHPALAALVVTGYDNPAPADAEGLPRLAKPFRQAELAARIADLLPADLPVEAALTGR